ncbi:MAG: hypothetical protein ACRECH_08770 [Nitrososphaerales archaeon]
MTNLSEILADLEPSKKVRQNLKVVGRTVFCYRCSSENKNSKEIASFYCPCGSFLCAGHLLEHVCLISTCLEYTEDLLASLS